MPVFNARRPRLGLPGAKTLKLADVEYRVVRNAATQEWDTLRNGAATNAGARKKRKSAVDSAIRDAKVELKTSEVTIVVTCLEGRKLETVWKGP